jgi:hypothetical protein
MVHVKIYSFYTICYVHDPVKHCGSHSTYDNLFYRADNVQINTFFIILPSCCWNSIATDAYSYIRLPAFFHPTDRHADSPDSPCLILIKIDTNSHNLHRLAWQQA